MLEGPVLTRMTHLVRLIRSLARDLHSLETLLKEKSLRSRVRLKSVSKGKPSYSNKINRQKEETKKSKSSKDIVDSRKHTKFVSIFPVSYIKLG